MMRNTTVITVFSPTGREKIIIIVYSQLDQFPGFTSRFFGLFCQFTEGRSESGVSRLGSRASIGYDGAVEGRRGEWADRRRGTCRCGDHS